MLWNVGKLNFTVGFEYRTNQDNAASTGIAGPDGFYTFSPGTPLTATLHSTNGGLTFPLEQEARAAPSV